MKKVHIDLSGHSNVADADVLLLQNLFDALKAAADDVGMVPLKAEFTVTPMGE